MDSDKKDQPKNDEKEAPKEEQKKDELELKKTNDGNEPKKEEPEKEEVKKEVQKNDELKEKEATKEEKKEDKKDEKEEDKKDEKKEDKKEEKEEDKKEEKEEDKKEDKKDEGNPEGDILIKTQVDKKLGIKNAVEDNDLKSTGKTWDDLGIKEQLHKNLLDMEFIEPSTIQAISYPLIMKEPRLSLIAQAKNGSGKTGAFGLGVISSIDENSKDIQAVVLSPTRELNNQIADVLTQMSKLTKIKVTTSFPNEEPSEYGQIVVTTPVHFESTFLKRNKNLIKNLKIMVLDEADEIIKNETLSPAAKRAFATFKKEKMKVQVLFFSATFDNKCLRAIKDFYNTVYMIEVKKEELTLKNVTQLYEDCKSPEDKITFVENYLKISTGSQRVIIFVNEKRYVIKLKEALEKRGRKVYILMGGDMSRENRDETIRRFRNGQIQILITTNLLARGYDERSVKLVINFDLPVRKTRDGTYEPDYENYLHRIGRTGRFGTKGIGLNLLCYNYDYINLQKIENFYKTKIKKMSSLDDLMEQLKNFYLE